MANKTIPQLGQVTAATSLDYLVITDSGETTTSKITKADFIAGVDTAGFIQGDASQSLVPYYFPTSSGTTSGTTYVDKLYSVGSKIGSTDGNLIIDDGTLSTITSTGTSNIIVGDQNTISGTGSRNTILNGAVNTLSGGNSFISAQNATMSGNFNTILGGQYHNLQNNNFSFIGGGYDNDITGSGGAASILGGENNDITSSGAYNSIIGGDSNTISSGTHSAISSSIGSTADGDTTIDISASYQSEVTGASYRSIIAGTYQSSINAGTGCAVIGTYADITGNGNGYDIIAGGISHTLTSSSYSTILGGQNNTITSSNESALISTNGSLISGGSLNSVVLGGKNTTIGANEGSVMVGTSGKTALYDYTTHVENIHTFKTETFDTISGGTVGGSIDVDLSLGTIYKFTMSANTTPNFINWREGQRIEIVVVNSSNYTVPTATITGGGSVLSKGGNLNPTNNGITKYKGIIVDGDLYLNEELNFQTV